MIPMEAVEVTVVATATRFLFEVESCDEGEQVCGDDHDKGGGFLKW